MIWSELDLAGQTVLPDGSGARVDPYWIWAKATGFANFPGKGRANRLQILIELRKSRTASHLIAALKAAQAKHPGSEAGHPASPVVQQDLCTVPPAYLDPQSPLQSCRYCTALVEPAFFDHLATTLKEVVQRVDLNVRIAPVDEPDLSLRASFAPHRPQSDQPVLMGVIDDGCAFAHRGLAMTRPDSGSPSCRLLAIWDQEPDPRKAISTPGIEDERMEVLEIQQARGARERASIGWGDSMRSLPVPRSRHARSNTFKAAAAVGNVVPWQFLQGIEVLRGQLETVMNECRPAGGTLDEDACYLVTTYDRLRSRVTHGAHVLDLLTGTRSLAERLRRRTRPRPATDATVGARGASVDRSGTAAKTRATSADVVFVQMPRAELRDPSGMWLGASVLDGLRYILGWANDRTECIVANVSYAPQHGPHDGTSILECAMAELAAKEPRLRIVLPAGNGYSTRGHAVAEMAPGQKQALRWRILPDTDTPSFLELWLPAGAAEHLQVSVMPPGSAPATSDQVGVGSAKVWPTSDRPQCGVIYAHRVSRGLHGTMILVAVSPTVALEPADAIAPCGVWSIVLHDTRTQADAPAFQVHAYVVRNDVNLGVRRRDRQSYLLDGGQVDDASIGQAERGTLSAIATGAPHGRIYVAAGYRAVDGKPAHYSAAGPARGPSSLNAIRWAPDGAAVTEECVTLPGVPAAGTRSGAIARLRGTSMAAPQVARRLADDSVAKGLSFPSGRPSSLAVSPRYGPLSPEQRLLWERLGDLEY